MQTIAGGSSEFGVRGQEFLVFSSWFLVGEWMLDTGYRILDAGCWILPARMTWSDGDTARPDDLVGRGSQWRRIIKFLSKFCPYPYYSILMFSLPVLQ